jgi:hypothetical protein
MNALLSMGNLTGDTVTCPFHGAKFDVITGKKLTEPILTPSQGMEPLPQSWQKFFENVGQLMAPLRHMIKQLMKQDSMEIGSKSRFNTHPALRALHLL